MDLLALVAALGFLIGLGAWVVRWECRRSRSRPRAVPQRDPTLPYDLVTDEVPHRPRPERLKPATAAALALVGFAVLVFVGFVAVGTWVAFGQPDGRPYAMVGVMIGGVALAALGLLLYLAVRSRS